MKILELLNNIRLPITNEEADLLGKFSQSSKVRKKDLNERERIIANNLVNKDILTRSKHEGKIFFKKKIK